MRFNHISVTNFRLVGQSPRRIDFSRDKNVVILLCDNGLGKTTILDAMATSIAPYPMQFPGISDYQLSDMDVHIDDSGRRAEYLTVNAEFLYKGRLLTSTRYRKGTSNPPKSNYEDMKNEASVCKEAILGGEDGISIPIFAYYGTGRGQFEVPARKRGFAQTYERWDCYKNALTPATDFKRFFGWFDLMEDEERRTMEKLKDWNYRLPVLNAVRDALSCFITKFTNPHIEIHPLRFVMDSRSQDGGVRELRIEQMSDGYKIVISMVADLAARMAEANPHMPNPLEGEGIVLIDEVDLHLHPLWQRRILSQLHSTFPNIQFIVSTHSPIIVVGAGNIAQIVHLSESDEAANTDVETENIGQILLSDLFGLESLFSPEWDRMISEQDMLLSKTDLSEAEKEKLDKLNQDLSKLSYLYNPGNIKANKLLMQIAKQLNVEL